MKRTSIVLYAILVLYAIAVVSGLWLVTGQVSKKTKAADNGLRFTPRDAIAIVEINGPIRFNQKSQRFLSYDAATVTRELREFAKRNEIRAIILRINSPGGTVAAVQEIYEEIIKARAKGKIVVASMGDVAASGGYYIASACDRIVANRGTLTGSIGVILELSNVQELFKKIGVKVEVLKTGKYKDSGSAYRQLTPEEKALFENLINDAYGQFVDDIVKGRKMDKQKVLSLADGRIFTGSQALNAGLIDALGNDEDALELAKTLAKIKGTPRIINESAPWNKVFSMFGEQAGSSSLSEITEIIGSMKVRMEYMLE